MGKPKTTHRKCCSQTQQFATRGIRFQTNLLVDQILGNVYLSQGQFIMVFVIQHVHQISVEWVDVLKENDTVPNFTWTSGNMLLVSDTKGVHLQHDILTTKVISYYTRDFLKHLHLRQAWGSRWGSVWGGHGSSAGWTSPFACKNVGYGGSGNACVPQWESSFVFWIKWCRWNPAERGTVCRSPL